VIDLHAVFTPVFREHYPDSRVWIEMVKISQFVLLVQRGARRDGRTIARTIVEKAARCEHAALNTIFDEADNMIAQMRKEDSEIIGTRRTPYLALDRDTWDKFVAECNRHDHDVSPARIMKIRYTTLVQDGTCTISAGPIDLGIVTAVDPDRGTITTGMYPIDPLDVQYDGVTLRDLIELRQHADREKNLGAGMSWRNADPWTWTQNQKDAVSAHWSAQLRLKVKATAEVDRIAKRNQVTYCEED